MQVEVKEDVTFNMYAFDPKLFRAARTAYMEKRGPGCFDFKYYLEKNPEIGVDRTNLVEVWGQFVHALGPQSKDENDTNIFRLQIVCSRHSHSCSRILESGRRTRL